MNKCKYTVVRDENLKTIMDEISNKVKFINTVNSVEPVDQKDYKQIIMSRDELIKNCNNIIHIKHWTYNKCTDNVRMIAAVSDE